MPVYGISTQKVDERLDPWVNTYYLNAPDRNNAELVAEQLATAEATIHSTLVTITGAHVWRVGAAGTDFSNPGFDYPGTVDAAFPLPPWFTAEVTLVSAGSYPGYKRYRTRVSRGNYDGPAWNDAYVTLLETFADIWDELYIPLSTRSGVNFTGMDPNAIPAPLQLSKAWYNRAAS